MSFIKLFNFLFSCICISISFVQADDYEQHEIKATALHDTSWTNPSDGSNPTLKTWTISLILHDGYIFEMNNAHFSEEIDPRTFFNKGDSIQILQEAYVDNQPSNSWFKIIHQPSGQEFELRGLSRRPKPINEPNIPVVERITKSWGLDGQLYINFFITNLESYVPPYLEIYTSIPITSEKYHGYYNGMPLLFTKDWGEELDSLGKYRKKLSFFHPIENAEITIYSKWMGGPRQFTIEDVNVHSIKERETPTGSRVWDSWTTTITLNDGEQMSFLGGKISAGNTNAPNKGEMIELLIEENPLSLYAQYQTYFDVKNLTSGRVERYLGSIRYLDGYKIHADLNVVESKTSDKGWGPEQPKNGPIKGLPNVHPLISWKTVITLNDGRKFQLDGSASFGFYKWWERSSNGNPEWKEVGNPGDLFKKGDRLSIKWENDSQMSVVNRSSGAEYNFNKL